MIGGAAQRLRPATLYAHERGSLLVPLPFLDLPAEAEFLGEGWDRKHEFHLTAAHTPSIAQRVAEPLGLLDDEALDVAWEALRTLSLDLGIGAVTLSRELRVARRDEERTLIVLCEADGLGELFEGVSELLGTEVAPPPAHVTLYTRPGGESIGLHTSEELERDAPPLSEDEAAEALAAIGAG